MNPVTGAVPPLIRGHGIRFEVDRWTWRRLDAARFDGERRHLLATRGRPWHADPRHGGDTDALETWHLLAGRHQGGGMGLTVTGPGGKLDVSWEPDGAIPPDGRFYCVCSIESGPCERVDVFHVSGRFWSTSACGEKRTPARPAWTSFPS